MDASSVTYHFFHIFHNTIPHKPLCNPVDDFLLSHMAASWISMTSSQNLFLFLSGSNESKLNNLEYWGESKVIKNSMHVCRQNLVILFLFEMHNFILNHEHVCFLPYCSLPRLLASSWVLWFHNIQVGSIYKINFLHFFIHDWSKTDMLQSQTQHSVLAELKVDPHSSFGPCPIFLLHPLSCSFQFNLH